MAITIDPTLPTDSESPRQGASRIRNIVLQLLSLVGQGGGSAVTFSANPFNIDTSGNVTVPTTIVVPTPIASTQAATKGYVDSAVTGISVTSPGTPAPTVTTTLANTAITAGSNVTAFTLASTPPGTPTTSQKYRALVSCTIYFQGTAVGTSASLNLALTDSGSIFSNKACAAGHYTGLASGDTPSVHFCFVSNLTATNAGGAITFTVTAYALSGAPYSGLTMQAASNLDANSKSILSVAWIPAI